MPTIAIGSGHIAYEESGRGDALIFVSGLGGVGRYWAPQVPVFSRRYRVVTYDHRGTGGSDRVQREFSVDGMTRDLVALMDALGMAKAHVVGLSTGGAIGQTLAIEHPGRLDRLVMCSTWTHCDPWFRRLFEARRRMYLEAGSALHAMFHPLWLYPPDYVNSHDAEIEEERSRAGATAPPVEVSVARIDALLAFDRRAGLSRIRAKTLVVASDTDYITPCYHAEALAAAIPGAKLAMVGGAGHSVSKTRPDDFNRIVLDFLGAAG